MTLQGRSFVSENSRFGYQGSERDPEVLGGNEYTTDFRMLDVRVGRWFSPDPITHPWQSPYVSMDNNPVALNDPLGLSTGGEGSHGSVNACPNFSGSAHSAGGNAGAVVSSADPFSGSNTSNIISKTHVAIDAAHSQSMEKSGGSGNSGLNTAEIVDHMLMDATTDHFELFSWINGDGDDEEDEEATASTANEFIYSNKIGFGLKMANASGDKGGKGSFNHKSERKKRVEDTWKYKVGGRKKLHSDVTKEDKWSLVFFKKFFEKHGFSFGFRWGQYILWDVNIGKRVGRFDGFFPGKLVDGVRSRKSFQFFYAAKRHDQRHAFMFGGKWLWNFCFGHYQEGQWHGKIHRWFRRKEEGED